MHRLSGRTGVHGAMMKHKRHPGVRSRIGKLTEWYCDGHQKYHSGFVACNLVDGKALCNTEFHRYLDGKAPVGYRPCPVCGDHIGEDGICWLCG